MTPPARRVLSALLLLATPIGMAAVPNTRIRIATLPQGESLSSRHLLRAAQFLAVPHLTTRPACERIQPPEPLTTPDPLFAFSEAGESIKVSFIVGADGHVYSPLILESAGLARDRHVLETVRSWRYRPATCNGVPTETEGKIEFSNR